MNKRRLSDQQLRRIRRQQNNRVTAADGGSEQLPAHPAGTELRGLVIANFGGMVEVESGDADRRRCSCHVRANVDSLVAGDRVSWCPGDPHGVVIARESRESELQRPDRRGRQRAVAANVQQLLLVIAPRPEPHANLIDRYLVGAETAGIPIRLVLNKVDLLDDKDSAALDVMLAPYQALDYRVLRASTRMRHGLDELQRALLAQVTVLVGQSGVGKSSLIQSLLPEEELRIGQLSEHQAGKGRHTTTSACVYHLPDGGSLIDSPGIREFTLMHLEPADVARGFREMRPLLGRCQFRDCQHIDEPGCAVRDAVANGRISAIRHDSYCRIVNDKDGR